jgi:sugar lactone lactonase YvrE
MFKATIFFVGLLSIARISALIRRASTPLATPRVCFALFLFAIGLSSQATAQSCVNLQCFQVTCLGSATTSISGTVYAPNGADPIPNVIVYVPNGTVEPFVDGPADDTEASLVTGSPLVSTTTAANGTFTLTDVPAGTAFPLVLQAGRWRRQLTVPSVTSCVNTPVSNFNPAEDVFARFPKTQVEGDIPKMALATGAVDALECSLRKIGIADTEFTDYTVNVTGLSEPGRISLFEGSGSSGVKAGGTVHTEDELVGSTSSSISGSLLGNYNVLLLPCQGINGYIDADGRGNAITFADEGGRIFATHHSVLYLNQDASIDAAADWRGLTSDSIGAGEATIDTSFSSGMTLAQWLQDIGATSTLGQVAMTSLFSDQTGINLPTQSWAAFNTAEFGVASPILQLSFYTPVGAAAADQFGRVMYNEYHVDTASTNSSVTFPAECTGSLAKTAAFTAQEHMLEYSLFDLMNFSLPVVAPTVSIGITHSPSTFTGGDGGDTITVTVDNTGVSAIPTTPPVYLTATLPAGLTPVAMTDSAGIYSCNISTLTCTLTSAWGASVSDPVTITVEVAANVSEGSPSVSATVASAGFSSNVTSPITLNIDTAPAGTVTTGASVSAGTVDLQSTGSATAAFAISAGTTVGTISVVTQGATGLDFTNAGSGTCTTTTYGSSASCTVNVTFTPTHPGPRYGAVEVLDGSGNLLATQYITAIGVSPQLIFSPDVQSSLGGGFSQPDGVATDSSGNIYVADQANNAVKKLPSGCSTSSCVTTIGGGFSSPYGIAVDGAGNVWVADNGNNAVKKIPGGCTTSSCVITVDGAIGSPAGLAVDGFGNVFVTDSGDGIVFEIPQGCTASSCTVSLGGGFGTLYGIAVDGNGNVFVADNGNAAVKELPASCTTTSCVSTLGGGISQPYSVVVDASGNVFVGDQGSSAVRKIPSGCTSSSCVSTLSGTFLHPVGVALDGSGNLFVSDTSTTVVAKLDFADPPALTFPSTRVGSTSSAQSVIASNDGNAVLNLTASGLTAPTDFLQTAGGGSPPDCADSGAVTAGASCNLSLEFGPQSTGSFSETFVLTDNNLNVTAATQSISLGGTAIPADSTSTAVGVSPSPPIVGQTATITATVSDTTNISTVPTGSVTFSDSVDGSLNGGAAVALVSGVASLTGVILSGSIGTSHTITANYQGVADTFLASSNTATVVMAAAPTTTGLGVVPSGSVVAGTTVSFTATVAPAPVGSPTGTVSFYNGATLLGSGPVNSSGIATFATSTLPAGVLSLTAVYSGNTGFAGSTSPAVNETVEAVTTTTLIATPNPAVAGQSVTITATVLPAPTGSSTGTVSFYDGETLLGSGPVNSSGIATFITSSLPAGILSLTAVYSGNTGFAGSTSPAVSETVKAETTTTLVATPNPAVPGQSVTITATVLPAPTGSSPGTISFYNGETLLGSGPVNSSGIATFITSSLPTGVLSLTAVYSGNAGFAGSTSPAVSETVKAETTTTLVATPNPAIAGQSVTLTGTVLPAPTGSSPGTVSFYNGETLLGTDAVNSSGIATFTTSSLPAGILNLTAVYSGNAGLAGSTSPAVHETVQALTATALAAAPNPAVAAQSVTFTATVAPAPTGSSPETVSFYNGETLLGTDAINSSGIATFATSNLPVASNSITAVYSGNAGFAGSTSSAVIEIVTVAGSSATTTKTALVISPNPVADGQPATLTATVTPAPTGTPAGIVSFYRGTTLLGTGTLNSSGVAALTTTSLVAGDDSITAVYPGDAEFAASTSSAVAEVVTTAYNVTAPPAPVTVAPGGMATFNISVPPRGGTFDKVVTMSASGLPPGAVATFNPPTVTPGSTGAPTVMTIQLPQLIAGIVPIRTPAAPQTPVLLGLFSLLFAACGVLCGIRQTRFLRLVLAAAALAVATLMFTGCGGGLPGRSSTPPGSYIITVTGTSGALHESTTVTLGVE